MSPSFEFICLHRDSRKSFSAFNILTLRLFASFLALGVLIALHAPAAWATPASTTTTLTVTSGGSDVTSVASGTVVTLTATVVSGSTKVTPGQVRFCDASAK